MVGIGTGTVSTSADATLSGVISGANALGKSGAATLTLSGSNTYAGIGKREGDISLYWFEHGWFWFIPLADGTTSVGAVCWPYYLKSRAKPVPAFFDYPETKVALWRERSIQHILGIQRQADTLLFSTGATCVGWIDRGGERAHS